MKKVFEVEVTDQDRKLFASLSGDYNPLHVDLEYSKQTNYGRPIMHGAFHAGLLSRMAGMYLPGEKCILHDIKLRFNKPLHTPASLIVLGEVISDDGTFGRAKVAIVDKNTSATYAEGEYQFGRHKSTSSKANNKTDDLSTTFEDGLGQKKIIVTGANGGIGSEVCRLLGD